MRIVNFEVEVELCVYLYYTYIVYYFVNIGTLQVCFNSCVLEMDNSNWASNYQLPLQNLHNILNHAQNYHQSIATINASCWI